MSEFRKNWIAPIATGTIAAVIGGSILIFTSEPSQPERTSISHSSQAKHEPVAAKQLEDIPSDEDMHALAGKFCNCVALNKILAEKAAAISENAAKTLEGAARGASVAAVYIIATFAKNQKTGEDLYANLVLGARERMLSILELGGGSLEALSDDVRACEQLNPLQAKIVTRWRLDRSR